MKLVCVIVTYNRLEKLKNTLLSYSRQECFPEYLIVVDNHSSDGTAAYLENWQTIEEPFEKKILQLKENQGGAGGFYEGCKYASSLNPDWIFVADDDAYPTKNIFRLFSKFLLDNDCSNVSALCSSVISINGEYCLNHRRFLRKKYNFDYKIIDSERNEYTNSHFKIDLYSYVGTFLRTKFLNQVGLCNPELFIYFDDTEHSIRMNKVGDIICVPQIQIIHDDGNTVSQRNKKIIVSWRDYYIIRNQIYMFMQINKFFGIYKAVRFLIKGILYSYRNLHLTKLYFVACFDGVFKRLGRHSLYRPPFVIERK